MAVAFAQSAAIASGGTGTLTSTLAGAPTAGNIIVAVFGSTAAAAVTTMTTPATGWTTIQANNTAANNCINIWARVVAGGEGAGYTMTSTAGTNLFLHIYEISGADSTVISAIPAANHNATVLGSAGTTLTLSSLTPTSNLSAIGIAGMWWSGGTTTAQSSSPYTILQTGTLRGSSSFQIISPTTGTYGPSFSWTTNRTGVGAQVIVQSSVQLPKPQLLLMGAG